MSPTRSARPGSAHPPSPRRRYPLKPDHRLERAVAYLAAAGLFLPSPITSKISVGSLVCIVALPLVIRQVRGVTPLIRLGILFLAFGAAAAVTAVFSLGLGVGRTFVTANAVAEIGALVTLATAVLVAYWCSCVNGVIRTAIVIGASGIVGSLVFITPEQADNPWKYVLAWPVCVLVLAVASRFRLWVAMCSFALLAGVSLWAESRNAAGAIVLAAVVTLMLRWAPSHLSVGRRILILGAAVGAGAVLVFVAITQLIAAGVFGAVLQERGIRQGAIWLLGSRVEPFAMLGYLQNAPLGMGLGVAPSPADVQAALARLADAGIATTEYISQRLVGPHVDPHSILGSFWWDAGLVGVALGIYLLALLVRYTFGATRFHPLVAFLFVQAGWDIVFSPLIANGRWVGIALGLILAVSLAPAAAETGAGVLRPREAKG